MINPLETKELPKAPSVKKLLGPSFIILGLGLGSGELILWPYLTSHYGLGIIWGALLGLTFQFFMNLEIERYALVYGESVFVGLKRKVAWIPGWFLISTFLPWIWPGIIASSAALLGSVLGIKQTTPLAIGLLVFIGLILTLGPTLYRTVETLQKVLILIGVPSIFILAVLLAKNSDWISLAKGIVGIGEGYFLLPVGLPIASFLAALAYSGAGGNLNLAQSFYIKEKGYGMGSHGGKITSLLSSKVSEISLTGARFEVNKESLSNFKHWWKNINLEHLIVFWVTGSITILLLGLLSFSTTYGLNPDTANISFVIKEAGAISQRIFPIAGTFFLLVAALTLFGTQLTVFDATSRILAENTILSFHTKLSSVDIPKIYYGILWLQIISGIIIFLLGFTEPLQLIILAAVLNAFAMFIHVGLTLWLNLTSLDKALRPNLFRVSMMSLAFLFYGGFSIYTIINRLIK